MQVMASNTTELVDCQRQLYSLQAAAAAANIQALNDLSAQQEETNTLMGSLLDGLDGLARTAGETLDAITCQTQVLEDGLSAIAEGLMQNQKTLTTIANTLAQPYETKVRELLREADVALRAGMHAAGKERGAEFEDTNRLLREVLDNPIGSRNYVAWFQTGWLLWQHENKIPEAEEAFFNAARLSKTSEDLYHLNSLRHLAHMQYLQARIEDAYSTIAKAKDLAPSDHDTLYDVARYAARTGRVDEATALLHKCIGLRPQTIVSMFSEEDFIA
jgi:tetratricopeptide (TPR) repeat protein